MRRREADKSALPLRTAYAVQIIVGRILLTSRLRYSQLYNRPKDLLYNSCGDGRIRTSDKVTPMPHFECGAFDHSATSPEYGYPSIVLGIIQCYLWL